MFPRNVEKMMPRKSLTRRSKTSATGINRPQVRLIRLEKIKEAEQRASLRLWRSQRGQRFSTPEDAKNLLLEDVVIGEDWAQNEIERYTYRMPGQAPAYYYGYTKMQALRTQTELVLRDDFDQQAFHDFILAQGMLPSEILKNSVIEEFIPSQKN